MPPQPDTCAVTVPEGRTHRPCKRPVRYDATWPSGHTEPLCTLHAHGTAVMPPALIRKRKQLLDAR